MRALLPFVLVAGGTFALAGCGGIAADGGERSAALPAHSPTELKAAGYTAINRTNLAFKLPAGWRIDPFRPGFARANSSTVVHVVQEVPAHPDPKRAVEELEAAFLGGTVGVPDTRFVGGPEIELGPVKKVKIDGRRGFAAVGSERDEYDGRTYGKVAAGFYANGIVVTAVATLEPGEPLSKSQVLDLLLGMRWSTERAPGRLSFVGKPAAGFKRLDSDARLIYSRGGKIGIDVPIYRVQRELLDGEVARAEQREYAELRAEADYSEPIEVNGLRGFEFTDNDETDASRYSAVLFAPEGYLIAEATYPPDDGESLRAFKEMTRSLKVRTR